jgi:hypothetical protein
VATNNEDPFSRALRLGKLGQRLIRKYGVTTLAEISTQTLLEESRELHAEVHRGRNHD